MIAPETRDTKRIWLTSKGVSNIQYPIKPTKKIMINSRVKYCRNFFIVLLYQKLAGRAIFPCARSGLPAGRQGCSPNMVLVKHIYRHHIRYLDSKLCQFVNLDCLSTKTL